MSNAQKVEAPFVMPKRIEVVNPRGVNMNGIMLFPGDNPVTPELAAKISQHRGLRNTLTQLAVRPKGKRPELKLFYDDKPGKSIDRSESLKGLTPEAAIKMVESSSDAAELTVWLKDARGKLREAIETQLALVDLDSEES